MCDSPFFTFWNRTLRVSRGCNFSREESSQATRSKCSCLSKIALAMKLRSRTLHARLSQEAKPKVTADWLKATATFRCSPPPLHFTYILFVKLIEIKHLLKNFIPTYLKPCLFRVLRTRHRRLHPIHVT